MNAVTKVYRADFDLDGTAMVCLIRAETKTKAREHVLKIASIRLAKPEDIIELAVGADAQVEIENAGAGEEAGDA